MKLFAPDWYLKFACIADKCRHSCCVGWEIDIDPQTLARYQNASGGWKKRFEENIVVSDGMSCFRLTEDERCPFLNERGLCEIILEYGQEALSQICTDHPRFRSFFADRTEIGLGMCCEEAARLILHQEEPAQMVELSDDGVNEEADETEKAFFLWRSRLMEIVQDRTRSLTQRIGLLCEAAGFSPDLCIPADWVDLLLSLERMDQQWAQRLEGMDAAAGEELDAGWDPPLEQLLFYLLLRHLPGAVEDGYDSERVALAVLLLRLVRCLFASVREQTMTELTEICRLLSSEIEYSDENTASLLDALADRMENRQLSKQ